MADGFITFTSGRTLTVAVLTVAGAARGSNPHSSTEFGSTGLYKFTEATMVAGDLVRVTDSVLGYVGGDEYLPEVKDTAAILQDTGTDIPASIAAIDVTDLTALSSKVDEVLVDTGTDIPAAIALVATGTSITTLIQQSSGQTNVYDERTK